MIKFVCATCGERLSVPDQHGGRKGLCPNCQSVNRIPLKGFVETHPSSPTVARNAPASAQTPMPAERETPQAAAPSSPRIVEPSRAKIEAATVQESTAPIAPPAPVTKPVQIAVSPVIAPIVPQAVAPMVAPPPALPASAPAARISAPPATPVSTERFTATTKFIPPPDDAANLRSIRRTKQDAVKNVVDYQSPTESVREWHLPKNLKIALLIIAALVIVGALYFGLLMALRAAVPGA